MPLKKITEKADETQFQNPYSKDIDYEGCIRAKGGESKYFFSCIQPSTTIATVNTLFTISSCLAIVYSHN
jgi:hypothetical protein